MLHRTRVLIAASLVSAAMITTTNAAEIQLLSSTAMREALDEVVPGFEKQSGHKVTISFYPAATLVIKVKEGVPADLVMTTPDNIETLTKDGKLVAGSRVDFAHSSVGVAVRAGAPKPDISTPDGLKNALLAAKSVGVSKGPSGVYLMKLMDQLGIADQIKAKTVSPDLGVRVGTLVAKGEAEIGVQQVNELLPIAGIDFVGKLPKELRTVIVYGAARGTNAKEWSAAEALVKYLTSPAAAAILKKLGLDPA